MTVVAGRQKFVDGGGIAGSRGRLDKYGRHDKQHKIAVAESLHVIRVASVAVVSGEPAVDIADAYPRRLTI